MLPATMSAPEAAPPSPEIYRHYGMCDTSAAVSVGADRFLAANDETNHLWLYSARQDGPWTRQLDLGPFLQARKEVDIEAAARVGPRVYWITSHGTNKHGFGRRRRSRFFATDLADEDGDVRITPVWLASDALYDAMIHRKSPVQQTFDLAALEDTPPKKGGLNIEGLAARPDGTLLIGLRSPTPVINGKPQAMVVPLLNPDDVIAGGPPQLGDPICLDLDGLGIRSLDLLPDGRFIVLAGPVGGGGPFRLLCWSGPGSMEPCSPVQDFHFGENSSPEGLVFYEHRNSLLVLLDEGERQSGTQVCKDLPEQERSFRSAWLESVSL